MARILAIDYGTKRVGIAVTDSLQMIASGLTTIHSSELVSFLENYLKKEEVECVVIGLPKNADNTKSELEKQIKPLLTHLKRKFPNMIFEREDERFTSKMAVQSMVTSGLKKKDRQNKSNIDMVSATIILQSYLERRNSRK